MNRPGLDEATIMALAKQTLCRDILALQGTAERLGGPFVECARLLIECEGLVWVTGVGTSAAVGQRFAHILSCSGGRSIFLSPSDGLHGHAAVLTPADLLVALSRGGESREVIDMVAVARRMGTRTLAFVHDTTSTLARSCDHLLPIQSPAEYELMHFLATTSTVVFSAVCDALCAAVLAAKGQTAEGLASVHPGGAVGQVLGRGSSGGSQ